MKEIELSMDKTTLVDDEDYEKFKKFKWMALKTVLKYKTFYRPMRKQWIPELKRYRTIYLHREIMGVKHGNPMIVDHIDGNTLNNTKSNLRLVTKRQNLQNLHFPQSSKYPGVCKVTFKNGLSKWRAMLSVDGNPTFLGYFWSEEDAFNAYKSAIEELGEEVIKFHTSTPRY